MAIKILAKGTSYPDWWKALTVDQQKQYIDTHPNTSMKVGFGSDVKQKKPESKNDDSIFRLKGKLKNKWSGANQLMLQARQLMSPIQLDDKISAELGHDIENLLDDEAQEAVYAKFGTTADFAYSLKADWDSSSTGPLALLIQKRAAAMFGTDFKIIKKKTDAVEDFGKYAPGIRKGVDAFLKATYKRTQDTLKASGLDTVYIYRGFEAKGNVKKELTKDKKSLAKHKIQMNPISSFSSSARTATLFGDYVICMKIPAKRVFSCAFTGLGAVKESEYVVMGSTIPDDVYIFDTETAKEKKKGIEIYSPWKVIEDEGEIAQVQSYSWSDQWE